MDGCKAKSKKREIFNESKYLGETFSYLTILKFTRTKKLKTGQLVRHCLCACKCGDKKEYSFSNIKSGVSSSCGCKPHKSKWGGLSRTKLGKLWFQIMNRCYNQKTPSYKYYGERGIDVYKPWQDLKLFAKEIIEILGEKPVGDYSIDRINNDRGYYPDNVRWASRKTQINNRRYSRSLTPANIAKIAGYSSERIRQLTNPVPSINTKVFPLKKFVEKEINAGKKKHIIYRKEVIEYLLGRKNAI